MYAEFSRIEGLPELSSNSSACLLLFEFKVFLYESPEPGIPALPVILPCAEREAFKPFGPAEIPKPFFETLRLTPGASFNLLRNWNLLIPEPYSAL